MLKNSSVPANPADYLEIDANEATCRSPEELLRSVPFAEFLSFYNRDIRTKIVRAGQLYNPREHTVLPRHVASSPDIIAPRVLEYWEGARVPIHGKKRERECLQKLIEQTVATTRDHLHHALALRDPYDDARCTDTPLWLLKMVPHIKKKLPIRVVSELEKVFQNQYADILISRRRPLVIIENTTNNFVPNLVLGRSTYMKKNRFRPDALIGKARDNDESVPSDLIQRQTWREFFAAIDRALEACGISREKLEEHNGPSEREVYVLPAFIKLMETGYRGYPDLSA